MLKLSFKEHLWFLFFLLSLSVKYGDRLQLCLTVPGYGGVKCKCKTYILCEEIICIFLLLQDTTSVGSLNCVLLDFTLTVFAMLTLTQTLRQLDVQIRETMKPHSMHKCTKHHRARGCLVTFHPSFRWWHPSSSWQKNLHYGSLILSCNWPRSQNTALFRHTNDPTLMILNSRMQKYNGSCRMHKQSAFG